MTKLKNTIVDTCVVVGNNQDTDLIHLSGGPHVDMEGYDKFGPYKQHVLSVFTEKVAYFPQATTTVEGKNITLHHIFMEFDK